MVYPYGTTYEQSKEMGALSSDDYVYGNTSWPDQLTGYGPGNGADIQTITYDGIGNPLSYLGWTFDWQGRQLTSASNGYYTITYKYDADGIRTSKTVNGTTTYYTYEGGKLRTQKTGDEIIWFQYGADGSPFSMTIGSTTYYYVKNLQGDVIGLTDATGALVVEYAYDAWGKFLSITGSLASTVGMKNPFWYRGYYFDTETGFYYLQSRYYDPTIRRFINADAIVSATNTNGMNLYAYCMNNPVCSYDPMGYYCSCSCGRYQMLEDMENSVNFETYDSADEAAYAFAEEIYSASYFTGFEFSAVIYMREVNGRKEYYYMTPSAGSDPHVANAGNMAATGWEAVAYAHTHPELAGDNFSDADEQKISLFEMGGYMIGPNLSLQRYSSDLNRSIFVAKVLPKELSTTEKTALVKRYKGDWEKHLQTCKYGCTSQWPNR